MFTVYAINLKLLPLQCQHCSKLVKKASVNLKFKAREYLLEISEASSTAVQS